MNDITLNQTCLAYPEQYDAFLEDKQVGFLHLRNGCFTVVYPDIDGETVYKDCPEGDGMFTDDERDFYLSQAKAAIESKLTGVPVSDKYQFLLPADIREKLKLKPGDKIKFGSVQVDGSVSLRRA